MKLIPLSQTIVSTLTPALFHFDDTPAICGWTAGRTAPTGTAGVNLTSSPACWKRG